MRERIGPEEHVQAIATELNHNPRDMGLAFRFMLQMGCTAAGYLERIENTKTVVEEERLAAGRSQTNASGGSSSVLTPADVASASTTTYLSASISIDSVNKDSEAGRMLPWLALIEPTSIPLSAFPLEEQEARRGAEELVSLGLMGFGAKAGVFRLSPEIQEAMRLKFRLDIAENWWKAARQLVAHFKDEAKKYIDDSDNVNSPGFAVLRELYPHSAQLARGIPPGVAEVKGWREKKSAWAYMLIVFATVAGSQNRHELKVSMLDQAIIASELPEEDRAKLFVALTNIANAYADLGLEARRSEAVERMKAIALENPHLAVKYPTARIACLLNEATVASDGNRGDKIKLLEEALALAETNGLRIFEAEVHANIAQVLLGEPRSDHEPLISRRQDHLRRAIALYGDASSSSKALALQALAKVRVALGEIDDAIYKLKAALEMMKAHFGDDAQSEIAEILVDLGKATPAVSTRDRTFKVDCFVKAKAIFAALKDEAKVARVNSELDKLT